MSGATKLLEVVGAGLQEEEKTVLSVAPRPQTSDFNKAESHQDLSIIYLKLVVYVHLRSLLASAETE